MKSETSNTISAPPRILPIVMGGARPFWSVMVPAYNPRADYLEETLRCILKQDPGLEQMQIEVVDDCSPDVDVKKMVESIAGNRVLFSQTPKNLGLAGCWNTCIERARGEWIHVLHQDDLVFPGFYGTLRHGIEGNLQVGAAYCRHAYCDENGHWHRLSLLEMPLPGVFDNFVEPLVTAERIQCASIVVRRSTYERLGGFNADLKHALDWEMWIRIANKFPIYYEPKILACWRNHSGATTSNQIRSGENIRDIAEAIGVWQQYLPESKAQRLADFARERFANEGLNLARWLLGKDDIEGCLNQLKAALVCNHTPGIRLKAFRIGVQANKRRVARPCKAWVRKTIFPYAKRILRRGAPESLA